MDNQFNPQNGAPMAGQQQQFQAPQVPQTPQQMMSNTISEIPPGTVRSSYLRNFVPLAAPGVYRNITVSSRKDFNQQAGLESKKGMLVGNERWLIGLKAYDKRYEQELAQLVEASEFVKQEALKYKTFNCVVWKDPKKTAAENMLDPRIDKGFPVDVVVAYVPHPETGEQVLGITNIAPAEAQEVTSTLGSVAKVNPQTMPIPNGMPNQQQAINNFEQGAPAPQPQQQYPPQVGQPGVGR